MEKELKVIVSETGSDKLNNNLDKVNEIMKTLPISAKEMVEVFKKGFDDISQQALLCATKIEAIVTELNTHTEQAIDKNIEAGEKLEKSIEKSTDSSLSVVKIKAIEASAVLESYINKIAGKTEDQSTKLAQQVEQNEKLLERSTEINKEYQEKDEEIGILNLKAHKENITERVEQLKKLKEEMELAVVYTKLQYDAMSTHYDKDSEDFARIQNEKKAAIESLQTKIKETNTILKESNTSYMNVWKQQHKKIGDDLSKIKTDIEEKTKNITEKVKDKTKEATQFVKDFETSLKTLEENQAKNDELEKENSNKKYDDKIAKLDKERGKLREEITKKEKEKTILEKEQSEAEKKAKKYESDIKKIEQYYGENAGKKTDSSIEGNDIDTSSMAVSENSEDSEQSQDNIANEISDEERDAAQKKIEELRELAEEQKGIAADKQASIEETNNAIVNSERSVLLEQMRIDDEKAKLLEEKQKKEEEINARAEKRKEKFKKIAELKEKVEAKIKAVREIAEATKDIALGVTKAWAKGPILGPPLAALVAIQGALQLKMMTAQLAKFADGGLLSGKCHAQGGMRIEGSNIEVEGGEYVVNRESTNKNLGLVRYINSQRRELSASDMISFFAKASQGYESPLRRQFEAGGQIPAIASTVNADNEALVDAIKSIKFAPRVAVTDILRVQDEMTQIDRWSGV